jgi:hypothetical protein
VSPPSIYTTRTTKYLPPFAVAKLSPPLGVGKDLFFIEGEGGSTYRVVFGSKNMIDEENTEVKCLRDTPPKRFTNKTLPPVA